MKCEGCPFNDGDTLEATQAQNWGCLPSSQEMKENFDKLGIAHSCHEDENKPCVGLSVARPQALSAPIFKYSEWYNHG